MPATKEAKSMNLMVETAPLPEAVPDLPVADGYELIDGRLVEKPMGAKASRVGARLTTRLEPHVSNQKLGLVFISECGYQIFKGHPKKVRKPDVSFVARGRLPGDQPPEGNMRIPPDLAVEVISPNDLAEDIEARVDEYLEAGTRLMWLLYPATESAWVVRQDGSGARLKGGQELSGEDVVPGFACPVQALFADVRPA
jgi:Uma2 family endonuclease